MLAIETAILASAASGEAEAFAGLFKRRPNTNPPQPGMRPSPEQNRPLNE